jgi:hypothetical protein
MNEITMDDFIKIHNYFKKKTIELMDYEKNNDTATCVPPQNYLVFSGHSGRTFYSAQSNTFKSIVNELLIKAQQTTPEKFGTGEANDVLEAMRLLKPEFTDLKQFKEFLSHEQCTYVFEGEGGKVVDRMLRIDLFRLIKLATNGRNEFVGGLFHALKYFSRRGVNYSTGKNNQEIPHPQELIGQIINAFFCHEIDFLPPDIYIAEIPYGTIRLKIFFYRKENTDVFFLDTVY